MWLLDANMDVHLASVLTGFNISCDTAGKRGWKALSNGDLVSVAVDAGFRCLLTRDQLFGESASRGPKAVSAICRRGCERPTAALGPISRTIPRTMAGPPNRASGRPVDSVAVR